MINLANRVTFIRILLIPIFMAFLLSHLPYGDIIAVIIFILAAVSDGVDGYLARLYKQTSILGKILDPLADKLLISAALISLVDMGRLSAWVAMVIISREFAVTAIRLMASTEGEIVTASSLGKTKTAFQIVAVALWIVYPLMESKGRTIYLTSYYLAFTAMAAAVILTIISGIGYFLFVRKIVIANNEKKSGQGK